MGRDFLMELGCEEIPAKMLPQAIHDLKDSIENALKGSDLSYRDLDVFAAPRRLTLLIKSLSEKQPDSKIQVVGPPRQIAFAPDGTPGKAALGFAKGQNISLKKLKFVKKNGKEFLMAEKFVRGEKTFIIMPSLLQKVFSGLNFPKMMRWGQGVYRFVRPVRSLLVLFGTQKVNMELFGVKSSLYTFGHRFLGQTKIKISSPKEYLPLLEKNFVIVDQQKRKERIDKLLASAAKNSGCRLVADASLVEEVTFLVDYPTTAVGVFSKRFLELPEEILITTLKHHQKCFSLKKEKKLVNQFLCVLNTKKTHARKIIAGNKLIIEGRLNDAEFYWKRDRTVSLEERIKSLESLQFHEKLGNYYQKSSRLSILSSFLSQKLQLDREWSDIAEKAAFLSKTDLTTEMVKDFPELQGIMGGIYSQRDGMDAEIARGIYEHYLPYALTGESPQSITGSILSISDKLDTLVGCFGLGLIPSGSRDPFALRRAAQGIIKVSVDKELHLSLQKIIDLGMRLYADSDICLTEQDTRQKIIDYFKDRMKFFFAFKGYTYDSINAVVGADFDDPFDVYQRVDALTRIRKDKDFEALAISHKRIRNIINNQKRGSINEHLLQEEDERELYKAYSHVEKEVQHLVKDHQYFQALKRIASLRNKVDNFFDHVLVMSEEEALKENRVSLLASLSDLFMKIADFSEIVVAGSN